MTLRPDAEPGAPSYAIDVVRERELARVRKLSSWLDSRFRIPGTDTRVGLDPILGLIPGVGDLVSLGLSGYAILAAHRFGLPKRTIARMLGNLGIDAVVGSIPIVGDLFDFAFKANRRNLKLIEEKLGVASSAAPIEAPAVQVREVPPAPGGPSGIRA